MTNKWVFHDDDDDNYYNNYYTLISVQNVYKHILTVFTIIAQLIYKDIHFIKYDMYAFQMPFFLREYLSLEHPKLFFLKLFK